jgi:hypothetical protein
MGAEPLCIVGTELTTKGILIGDARLSASVGTNFLCVKLRCYVTGNGLSKEHFESTRHDKAEQTTEHSREMAHCDVIYKKDFCHAVQNCLIFYKLVSLAIALVAFTYPIAKITVSFTVIFYICSRV